MSATSAGFGLRPIFKSGGSVVSTPLTNTIASGYAANIFQGAPVKIGTNGTLELAAAGDRAVGVFEGVFYVPTTGRPVVDNKWISGTVLASGTTAIAYYTRDPYTTYEIQGNAPITQDMMGQQMNWTAATAGSAVTGLSSVQLDVASSGANAGLRIVGLGLDIDNDWGDAFTIVQVQFSEHQDVANIAAY
jgi:hypothetical protein